jgi:hypothetical protein
MLASAPLASRSRSRRREWRLPLPFGPTSRIRIEHRPNSNSCAVPATKLDQTDLFTARARRSRKTGCGSRAVRGRAPSRNRVMYRSDGFPSTHYPEPCTSRPVSRRLIPRAMLDRWREPDPLVYLLQLLFLGNFFARGNLRVFRLGRARIIVAIEILSPKCLSPPARRSAT